MGIKTHALKLECQRLGLKYVGYRGYPSAPVWIVGEAPGSDEDQNGVPFCGASGKEQDRICADAGLGQSDVCFTNPYNVRPPNNVFELLEKRGIPLKVYEDAFFEELEEYKPSIIVATGGTALGLLCPQVTAKRGGDAKITLWKGSLLQSPRCQWPHYVVPNLHPAFVLREWSNRVISVFVLARVVEELAYLRTNGHLQPLPARELIARPSANAVIEYLTFCLNDPSVRAVSNDIEMIRGRIPYTFGIADSRSRAMSFSMWDYDDVLLIQIWRLLDRVLREKRTIGQNYVGFDTPWLEAYGLRPNPWLVDDTMVRHHVLWPELEHKLQFLTMQYTREPYYKDEGRLWTPKDGLEQLMRYNAMDSAVTYEVCEEQEKEFDERPHLRAFYENVQKRRTCVLHYVAKKGILTSPERLESLRRFIDAETAKTCFEMSTSLGRQVCASKADVEACKNAQAINLGSPQQVIEAMKFLKLHVPTDRKTGRPTTAEPALQKELAKTGHSFLSGLLNIREYNKIKGTYVDAKLAHDVFYCSYSTTATVTFRLGSRANVFGLGGNHQNIPKHSKLGKKFRECLIARPGKVIIECDQGTAEDWVIQAIIADVSGNRRGLDELLSNADRHMALASFILSLPEDRCGRGTIERYLGKKTRYAASYDMHGFTMSEQLAKEGFIMTQNYCDWLLLRFHEFDPSIKGIFHAHIQRELMEKHMLSSPLGSERMFLNLRPYSDNSATFREGYAFIPQTTVSLNTGLAEIFINDAGERDLMIADGHDAIFLEVDDDDKKILQAVDLLTKAFDRVITFPNGTEIKIPIVVGVGYDFKNIIECDSLNETGLQNMLDSLSRQRNRPSISTGGLVQASSQQA